MTEHDDSIAAFLAINPKRYGFLEALHLEWSFDPATLAKMILTFHLKNSLSVNSDVMKLTFVGVRDLKTGRIDGFTQLVFEITSMRSSGWEDINYRVKDIEDDAFSFLCDMFHFEILAIARGSG